jgi:hypothetical protein
MAESDQAGLAAAMDDSLEALGIRAAELLDQARSNTATTIAGEPAEDVASCAFLDETNPVARTNATLEGRPVAVVIVEGEDDFEARAFYTDDCTEIDLP